MTRLYKVSNDASLAALAPSRLDSEDLIHGWIEHQPELLGLDVLIIGREVPTSGGLIDLLAIDREGDLAVLELKRDKTPRQTVAQVLDYASWVARLTTAEVIAIASRYLKRPFDQEFRSRFSSQLPETLNTSHKMIVIASAFDATSERIVKYLSEHHGVEINTAFFKVFEDNGQKFLTTAWLLDEAEVTQRSESRTKIKYSVDDLLAVAAERGNLELVETCRTFADQTTERPAPTYGGSLSYWYEDRIVLGVNVAGGRAAPERGALDVWVPVRTIAELSGPPEDVMRELLRRDFSSVGHDKQDELLRLRTTEEALKLVRRLLYWLKLTPHDGSPPGFAEKAG